MLVFLTVWGVSLIVWLALVLVLVPVVIVAALLSEC